MRVSENDTIQILVDDQPIDVVVKYHHNARRMKLRMSQVGGQVTLTLPPFVSLKKAHKFIAEQADWIVHERQNCLPKYHIDHGMTFPLWGGGS